MGNNYEKYEIYRAMKENLMKSMKAEFYYQAIFIEYAIIEDRCTSLLKHAGVKYVNSKGYDIELKTKINKIRSDCSFSDSFIRKRLPFEFLDRIDSWRDERNRLIHALAKIPYDSVSIKNVAEEGNEIVKELDRKVKSVNNHRKALEDKKGK